MRHLVHRAARRLSLTLAPGTGKHHAGAQPPWQPHPTPSAAPDSPLPAHRSPHGLDHPLDGAASRLVRPYLAAHEQECARQRRRRLALVPAADFGIDLDRHLVGTGEVAA
ncbi:hypothetical protein GCM10010145_35340 [Streptomyces ruber]|uniref:Uncharacterized protein n=2 Tax=Streptomyces TaxID=1883 RepID=A0A918BE02_9ACTN|nr:hypothetical protein [Streptomyces ruber]GGQ62372.1 hypothetical protein GCM10010145_35340 [Streptomyces ruber]